jgi:hypothetical protein
VKNPAGTASSKKSGSNIKFSSQVINSLTKKRDEYNEKHSGKVDLPTLKAVYRRGAGAYSSSHRPTITGGVPNSRNAWAMARVNKFLLKKSGKPVKKAYVQDDDLMAEGGQVKLLAPNGKPSNLTPEQYKLVRTPAFKAWFGDWEKDPENASKVIDENGEPLVVYHFSNKDFNIFKLTGISEGFFFTENKKDDEFSTEGVIEAIDSGKIPIWIKKISIPPNIIRDRLKEESKYENTKSYFLNIKKIDKSIVPDNVWSTPNYENPKITKAKNYKYDGIFFINEVSKKRIIVAFEPNQIKLADGSNTTFESNNPDIRYAEGGETSSYLAPNGNPSNLTPEQYRLVRTPEFKAWFGDWEKDPENASKVVDDNGEPMVMYHGGTQDFTIFDIKKSGQSNKDAKAGFWFTPLKQFASNFLEGTWWGDKGNRKIYEVFLSIKNPKDYHTRPVDKEEKEKLYDDMRSIGKQMDKLSNAFRFEFSEQMAFRAGITAAEYPKRIEQYKDAKPNIKEAFEDGVEYAELQKKYKELKNRNDELIYSDSYEIFRTDIYKIAGKTAQDANVGGLGMALDNAEGVLNMFREKLKSDGYDGIAIFQTRFDAIDAGGLNDQYVALYPEQIKLADGSNTTFDPNNPDIRYAKGGFTNQIIRCKGCGWKWDTKDSDDSDKYVCHQCGFDNRTFYDADPIGRYAEGGETSEVNADNYFVSTKAYFEGVDPKDAKEILEAYKDYRRRKNKPEFIKSTKYGNLRVDYESEKKNAYFERRSLSYYFVTEDNSSVIRISDHWSNSQYDDSEKLNCGNIRSCFWTTDGNRFRYDIPNQKHTSILIAGICSFNEFEMIPKITFDKGGETTHDEHKSVENYATETINNQNMPDNNYAKGGEMDDCGCGKAEDGMEVSTKKELPVGRLAKGLTIDEIARMHRYSPYLLRKNLADGIKTEMEHTEDEGIAQAIALDHIYEDPDYYKKLAIIEKLEFGSDAWHNMARQMNGQPDYDAVEINHHIFHHKLDAEKIVNSSLPKISRYLVCYKMCEQANEKADAAKTELVKSMYAEIENIWRDAKQNIMRDGGLINQLDAFNLLPQKSQFMGRGGLAYGNSHANGGIKLLNKSTNSYIEIEGGEGVVKADSMQLKEKMEFEGEKLTACEIVSKINERTGGVKFKCSDVKSIINNDGYFD